LTLVLAVPHGGLVTSTFLQVTSKHFATTLRAQGQPHTIIAHLDFLRRTQAGPAKLVVRDVKLGRQTSVIHITLVQNDQEEVTGTLTNSNINTESGLSLDTEYSLQPPPVPVDLSKLRGDTDSNWKLFDAANRLGFPKVFAKAKAWLPRQGQHQHSVADEWIAFSSGERFTNESLGFVRPLRLNLLRPLKLC
jgi:Thioesterase-like superfamily